MIRVPADHPLAQQFLTPTELKKLSRGKKRIKLPGEQTAEQKIYDGFLARFLCAGITLQHRFHPTRQWRWDFCWTEQMVAVEYDGLILVSEAGRTVVRGGHGTVTGIRNGNEKANAGQLLGWIVLRYDAEAVRNGTMYDEVESTLKARGYVHD